MKPDLVTRQKAAVQAGTTADTGWALPLAEYQTLASAFLESLQNFGAFDRMLPSRRRSVSRQGRRLYYGRHRHHRAAATDQTDQPVDPEQPRTCSASSCRTPWRSRPTSSSLLC